MWARHVEYLAVFVVAKQPNTNLVGGQGGLQPKVPSFAGEA
jgi:hypothetical protein